MSEETTERQPSVEDREAFDYLWQHLRRNPHYGKAWAEHLALEKRRDKLRREIADEKAQREREVEVRSKEVKGEAERTGRLVYIGSWPMETAKEKELRELSAPSNSLLLTAELSGQWRGGMIDPAHDTDTAMREVLEYSRGAFGPAEWRRLARRLSAPAAIWNWRGSEGCAWQNTPGDSSDFHTFDELQISLQDAERRGDTEAVSKCHAQIREFLAAEHSRRKPPCGDSHTFELLEMILTKAAEQVKEAQRLEAIATQRGLSQQAAQMMADMIAPGGICSHFQGTVAEYRALCDRHHAEAKAQMKRFLEDHPCMDFVLDTSLPFNTVRDELEKIFEGIKQLRVAVGMDEDEDPGRLPPKWRDNLDLYDACEPRLKRRAAFREIEKKGLGFVESFRLLDIQLPDDQMAFAHKLDAAGKKPGEVFDIFVEIERDPGRSIRLPATESARGEHRDDGQPREHVAAIVAKDGDTAESQPEDGEITEFDYDAIDANLGWAEPQIKPDTGGDHSNAETDCLRAWLAHFALPAVTLPDAAKNLPRSTRKYWFREARRRIAESWKHPAN